MAVPKKKVSKSRRDMRRSHLSISPVNYMICSNCGEAKLPHHACPHCGFYKGRQVLKTKNI